MFNISDTDWHLAGIESELREQTRLMKEARRKKSKNNTAKDGEVQFTIPAYAKCPKYKASLRKPVAEHQKPILQNSNETFSIDSMFSGLRDSVRSSLRKIANSI
ncbi:hypothetical protein ACVFI8_08215 [Agarivorans sp. MS3-6]